MYLKIDECKNGYLYKIHARNSSYGIYKEENKSFILNYPPNKIQSSNNNRTIQLLTSFSELE